MRLWTKWLPWRYVVRRVANAHGFLDPIPLLAKLAKFAQPSEVGAPIELLRAGVVFHARGLVNTKAIQSNLDWVWPYWVVRQFDPRDESFVPRSFSITHVNLTHRNWTAVGVPGCEPLPIVDPRGLVTPFYDGWSIDGWIVEDDGGELIPSRLDSADQQLILEEDGLAVKTESHTGGMRLTVETTAEVRETKPVSVTRYTASSNRDAWLVVSARPYNPEGISFVRNIRALESGHGFMVNDHGLMLFDQQIERVELSNYDSGDVYARLGQNGDTKHIECEAGMASAAALFRLRPGEKRSVEVSVDLTNDPEWKKSSKRVCAPTSWRGELENATKLSIGDARIQFLYDAAVRTLILHSPRDVWPGPYTYKRFWFRDAAYIINALLAVNLHERAERALDTFAGRQRSDGYFLSQEGEWDANGEAIWIMRRFREVTGTPAKKSWRESIMKGANWFNRKRTPPGEDLLHAGLLPAGFSAEHLGNNDYYLWDDFWAIAGLECAARFCAEWEDHASADRFMRHAKSFRDSIERAVETSYLRRMRRAYPASPYRRMDAGAIGSIVCGYPLAIVPSNDERLLDTIEYLLDDTFIDGAFFQNMIHSGWNVYLTLHVAQVLLRAGDSRYWPIVQRIAELASPTGQWPEAINPRTKGGCMGDGQHVWAAADWIMMIRNMFVREEEGKLILASGIPEEWLASGRALEFGPAPTVFGPVNILIEPHDAETIIRMSADWHDEPPEILIGLPGHVMTKFDPINPEIVVRRVGSGAPQHAGGAKNQP